MSLTLRHSAMNILIFGTVDVILPPVSRLSTVQFWSLIATCKMFCLAIWQYNWEPCMFTFCVETLQFTQVHRKVITVSRLRISKMYYNTHRSIYVHRFICSATLCGSIREETVLSCCIVWVHHHVPRAVVLLLIKGGACIHTSWLQQYSTWNVVMESIKILGTISVWGLPRISCCGHVSAVHACAKVYSLWCANQTDTTSGSGFLVLW